MTTTHPDRAARIAAIRDGAVARQHLGQAAGYRRLPDGRHQITVRGGRVFIVGTLNEAIELAKRAGK